MALTTAAVETQFAEQFRAFIKGEQDPALVKLRENAFAEFSRLGFPSVRQEDWKYTDVRSVANIPWTVFPFGILPDNEVAHNLDKLNAFNVGRNGFAALNM